MATENHQGVLIFMNGKKYLVPSLSVKQFHQHYELLTQPVGEANEINLKELMDKNMPMILSAVQRNYPDVNSENLSDWLDLSNFRDIMLAVQGTSPKEIREPESAQAAPGSPKLVT